VLAIIFGIVQMVKNEKKGLAIGGIITAVISIVLGIAVSLYAVNIAEKMQDPDSPFYQHFEEYEAETGGRKEFFLAGSYKKENLFTGSPLSYIDVCVVEFFAGDALNQITGEQFYRKVSLLVWLLADGSSDNAIIEQFFCGRNTVVSKDTHGIDPAAFDCGTASACYTAGCKIQHIDFGV